MNARFRMSIAALVIAGVLAGCASVTQGTQFQPPTGWFASPSLFGHAQVWIKQGKDKETPQMVMLLKGNSNKMDVNGVEVPEQYGGKDMKVLSRGPAKLCGNQAGQELRAQGVDKNGKRSEIDVTSTVIGKDGYMAMYVRPMSVPADAQAEASLHSLCALAVK